MSNELLRVLTSKREALIKLDRAPSQYSILLHLLSTGKTMTVKEVATEIGFTLKSTERAMAKLLDKNLIQRSTFRDGAYNCDNKEMFLILLLAVKELYEYFEKSNK